MYDGTFVSRGQVGRGGGVARLQHSLPGVGWLLLAASVLSSPPSVLKPLGLTPSYAAGCALCLAGDLELLQRALQHSGTDALAALQANTYRLPSALATEQAWNGALQHIGSMVAAHQTKSYAYYGVTQSGL